MTIPQMRAMNDLYLMAINKDTVDHMISLEECQKSVFFRELDEDDQIKTYQMFLERLDNALKLVYGDQI